MSDGERAIFYMIGQVLVADENSLLIIDEPELHVHRSIMSKLWDELEAIRPDCAFIFITHDLEFAAARSAQKLVIRDYDPTPRWLIEDVPENSGFDEELTTLILGSRRPVLFVEGGTTSLDLAIYRCCYPEWTVIPRGSCTEVIHSVVTMRKNKDLTRITCSGIVDADHRDAEEKSYLSELGIAVLPVSEIENIILLPSVSRAIAEEEGYVDDELSNHLMQLAEKIFETANTHENIERVAVRYCKRRVDKILKSVDLGGGDSIDKLEEDFRAQSGNINISDLANEAKMQMEEAISEKNLERLLSFYDDKGMIAHAAAKLKSCKLGDFEGWLTRILRNDKAPKVKAAISSHLPIVQPL